MEPHALNHPGVRAAPVPAVVSLTNLQADAQPQTLRLRIMYQIERDTTYDCLCQTRASSFGSLRRSRLQLTFALLEHNLRFTLRPTATPGEIIGNVETCLTYSVPSADASLTLVQRSGQHSSHGSELSRPPGTTAAAVLILRSALL